MSAEEPFVQPIDERTDPPPAAPVALRPGLEAILFLADEPVEVEILAEILEHRPDTVRAELEALAAAYLEADRGIEVRRAAGGWRMYSAAVARPAVERWALAGRTGRLTQAALETLAVVAYKQPISRQEISDIRGVNADGAVRSLVARGYVAQTGRDDGPGQAVLYGTTPLLLERLGLDSLTELPPLTDYLPEAPAPDEPELGALREVRRRLAKGGDLEPSASGRATNTGPDPDPDEDDEALPPPTTAIGEGRGDAGMDELTERLEHVARSAVDRLRQAVAANDAADAPTGPPTAPTGPQTAPRTTVAEPQRLQKIMAAAGVASRRASEELIAAGRVTINGRVAELGARCDPTEDVVELDGERLNVDPDRLYVMLNKPRGVVSTADDPGGRPTVVDLINLQQRLFPVGRLDQDTEGLLLLTNDGELTHRLLHPSFEVERTYVALVPGPVRKRALAQLRDGVELEDGLARVERVRVLEEERSKALVEIVMTEGRKREIRRMFGALGLTVERLARVAYGGVELGELRQGKWRFLTQSEIATLHAAAGSSGPTPRTRDGRPPRATADDTSGGSRKGAARGGPDRRGRRSGGRERDARAANTARARRRGGPR